MKLNCSSALALLLCAASVLTLTEAQKPNFIVMQPDDLRFFEAWTPPPHYPTRAQVENFPCDNCLPNIERLRTNGLQMMEAYTYVFLDMSDAIPNPGANDPDFVALFAPYSHHLPMPS